jgi:hypothetical protein
MGIMAATPGDKSAPRAPDKLESLNFKVPASFKKAFKGYAVAQGMSMVELLRDGFELTRRKRGE